MHFKDHHLSNSFRMHIFNLNVIIWDEKFSSGQFCGSRHRQDMKGLSNSPLACIMSAKSNRE